MEWSDVRLQVDVPDGWQRLDDAQLLTFEAASGLRLRVTPLRYPTELSDGVSAKPLMRWAMTQLQRGQLTAEDGASVIRCEFGLCASVTAKPGDELSAPLHFWFLANGELALLVSLQGATRSDDLARALSVVRTMRVVPATQYLN